MTHRRPEAARAMLVLLVFRPPSRRTALGGLIQAQESPRTLCLLACLGLRPLSVFLSYSYSLLCDRVSN